MPLYVKKKQELKPQIAYLLLKL